LFESITCSNQRGSVSFVTVSGFFAGGFFAGGFFAGGFFAGGFFAGGFFDRGFFAGGFFDRGTPIVLRVVFERRPAGADPGRRVDNGRRRRNRRSREAAVRGRAGGRSKLLSSSRADRGDPETDRSLPELVWDRDGEAVEIALRSLDDRQALGAPRSVTELERDLERLTAAVAAEEAVLLAGELPLDVEQRRLG